MPYGFSDQDWASAKAEVRTMLAATAKRRSLIAYSNVTGRMKSIRVEPNSDVFAALLRDVSVAEDDAGRGMLTVVVVHKTGDQQPGPGFYTLAAELGRSVSDRLKCWSDELRIVYDAHK